MNRKIKYILIYIFGVLLISLAFALSFDKMTFGSIVCCGITGILWLELCECKYNKKLK